MSGSVVLPKAIGTVVRYSMSVPAGAKFPQGTITEGIVFHGVAIRELENPLDEKPVWLVSGMEDVRTHKELLELLSDPDVEFEIFEYSGR